MEKQLIAYCGIDCSACPAYQITRAGGDLVARRKLAQEWSGVQCQFDAEEIACNGCMHSSWKMTERCNIRKCAIEKEKKTCGHCADYPCDKIHEPHENLEAIQIAINLVQNSKVAFLGSIGEDGYPNIKAMLELGTNGLETMYFSSNTSSQRVADLRRNPKACLYYVDKENFIGLMLVGEIEIVNDQAIKDQLWRTGFERYYPLGKTDPDYSILKFTSKWGKLYNGGKYVKCFHI